MASINMPPLSGLVLASASPRRRDMLARLGVAFRVQAADVDESRRRGEAPRAMTTRLAMLKAQTVFDLSGARRPTLGGDTAVAIGDEVLGKPIDREHAILMLRRLSGNTHTVFSAVALLAEGRQLGCVSATEVTFHRLEARQIKQYCRTAEPFDKAGAYGIQGAASAFVKHLIGSHSGAVGLPMWETWRLLREFAAG